MVPDNSDDVHALTLQLLGLLGLYSMWCYGLLACLCKGRVAIMCCRLPVTTPCSQINIEREAERLGLSRKLSFNSPASEATMPSPKAQETRRRLAVL